MLIEESTLSKNKFIRYTIGFFLFILVAMLIVTLMPSDAGGNLQDMLTGQSNTNAGKVGEESIPMDYFQAARSDCYNEYQTSDQGILYNCAYMRVRSLKIGSVVAEATGYGVSENSIKERLSKEARIIYKQSASSAGYSEEEIDSVSAIYRKILQSKPMNYWMDLTVSQGIYQDFLLSKIKKTDKQANIEEEAKNSFITLVYVSYSDENLLKKVESEIQISDEEALEEYEKAKKAGSLPKDSDGKVETFEKRKSFIISKLKYDKKQKKLSELKAQLQSLVKDGKTTTLDEIAQKTGTSVKEVVDYPIYFPSDSKAEKNQDIDSLFRNSKFLNALISFKQDNRKIEGPYKMDEKNTYVEIKKISIVDNKNLDKNTVVDNTRSTMYTIISEINQSIANAYPVSRRFGSQAQKNGN